MHSESHHVVGILTAYCLYSAADVGQYSRKQYFVNYLTTKKLQDSQKHLSKKEQE